MLGERGFFEKINVIVLGRGAGEEAGEERMGR